VGRGSRAGLLLLAASSVACTAPEPDRQVGELAGGGHVVATEQIVRPAGTTTVFDGRPLDLVVAPNGRFVFAKEDSSVVALDAQRWEVASRLELKEGCSMHGIAIARDGTKLYATGVKNSLFEVAVGGAGELSLLRTIALPGSAPYPCGVALTPDERYALVCLSRDNSLAVVDLASGVVGARLPVGVAPYDVVVGKESVYVSNFGGRRAEAGDTQANSSGTQIVVDARGIGASGTVTKLDLAGRSEFRSIECGLHPCDLELSADGARLYVAAANSDAVFVVDAQSFSVIEEIPVRPDPALPFGSITNALALAPDGLTLYAANGGNNALAVVRLGDGERSVVEGFIPTGWFPGAVATHGDELFVANLKGTGARVLDEKRQARKATRDRGSVSRITRPDASTLTAWTAQAREDSRVPQALRAAAARARSDVAPVPVPARPGEPSLIEHVVYVIKENRTYDQLFGDLPRGNNAPALCTFGREVTPNHHALAERFVQLDNYYCNGVLSSDGHQWATQGLIDDYVEKQFGGPTRSYDFGTDALAYASSDFLWDAALLHGLSFRNYGEFDFPQIESPRGSWFDVRQAQELRYKPSIAQDSLRRYSSLTYPGWELKISDQYRVDRFLEELAQMERAHEFPNLVIVYLPQDHTAGSNSDAPSPRAHVADNDLALGRLVEALSKSSFWPRMAVFVNEDDPQDGWDHVDGHRSFCLLAGPYVKRGALVSRFYNQTSVLRTIELILGLSPLSQRDAASASMAECFTSEPDLRPYVALANRIPLDERNPPQSAYAPDLSRPDLIDEDEFNRVIWSSVRGDEPYPAEWAGAHGRGLAALHLALEDADDDD
jgi:YVTN family beta-propeller protein